MPKDEIRAGLAELFREVFEGVAAGADGTWFVQGKEAIFDAVRSISSEQASKRTHGMSASIGAHVRHLSYYLKLFNANQREENPTADWNGSWAVQAFEPDAWCQVIDELEREYAFTANWYRSDAPFKNAEQATYAMANLAHAAYHLGAIRALMPIQSV